MTKGIFIKNSVFNELSKYKNGIGMSWSETLQIMIERSRENNELRKQITELNNKIERLTNAKV